MKYQVTIHGEASGIAGTHPVLNPATEEVIAEAPDCDQETLERAFVAAHTAYPAWAAEDRREERLLDCARLIKKETVKLSRLLTMEQGKPLRESMNELMGAASVFRYYAELSLGDPDDASPAAFCIRRQPLGVVAAITPWNYPVMLAASKIAPAILAGNSVVLKPSPYTPLTSLAIGEILAAVLPPGVLNVVSGGDAIGEAMTVHPLVRMVTLTGSVETGKAVARNAANDMKRLVLELGGNDAAIVLADADPKAIANDLFWGAFRNCGQVCHAIKRLYVHNTLLSPVVEQLKKIAEGVAVGSGLERGTELGPLNNRTQRDRVEHLVQQARNSGARVITGGEPLPGPGYFFQPTIIDQIEDGTALVDEEQFGPALPVIGYDNVADAIERSNASSYGLSGSVWSGDPAQAEHVARQMDCGTVWINQHGNPIPGAPTGGRKQSGIGYENGKAGFEEFCALQVVSCG